MTKVEIWFLLVPCLFLTSHMKVVLTASSTFFTISLLSSTITVLGNEPDTLEGKKIFFQILCKISNDGVKGKKKCRKNVQEMCNCEEQPWLA